MSYSTLLSLCAKAYRYRGESVLLHPSLGNLAGFFGLVVGSKARSGAGRFSRVMDLLPRPAAHRDASQLNAELNSRKRRDSSEVDHEALTRNHSKEGWKFASQKQEEQQRDLEQQYSNESEKRALRRQMQVVNNYSTKYR